MTCSCLATNGTGNTAEPYVLSPRLASHVAECNKFREGQSQWHIIQIITVIILKHQ